MQAWALERQQAEEEERRRIAEEEEARAAEALRQEQEALAMAVSSIRAGILYMLS